MDFSRHTSMQRNGESSNWRPAGFLFAPFKCSLYVRVSHGFRFFFGHRFLVISTRTCLSPFICSPAYLRLLLFCIPIFMPCFVAHLNAPFYTPFNAPFYGHLMRHFSIFMCHSIFSQFILLAPTVYNPAPQNILLAPTVWFPDKVLWESLFLILAIFCHFQKRSFLQFWGLNFD